MTKLTIAGIVLAVTVGAVHALLEAAWDFAIDDIDSARYSKGYPVP